jgi:hypothetical protein
MPINASSEGKEKNSGKLQSLNDAKNAPKMVRTTIYMNEEMHRKLQRHCFELKISVSQFIATLTNDEIDKWLKKHGSY